MRKSKNINLGQRGFTLVEVIVVAVIVAALAGVSIPLYNGYVANSRMNAAANTAGSVASFLGACYQSLGGQSGNGIGPTALDVTGTEFPTVAGQDTITCQIPSTNVYPRMVVPRGFVVRRIGNAIYGRHSSVAIATVTTPGTNGESAPFTFPVQ